MLIGNNERIGFEADIKKRLIDLENWHCLLLNKMPDLTQTELGELKLIGIRIICPPDQYPAEIPKAIHLLSERLTEIKEL